jgi:branched-chain amino acid aminotransferase
VLEPKYAWLDGHLVEWGEAALHVDTQTVLDGLNVYEVVGCFHDDASKRRFFRFADHLQRLRRSAKVMRIDLSYSDEELLRAAQKLIAVNQFSHDVGL